MVWRLLEFRAKGVLMEILTEYQNGNYRVTLYTDGTKIKRTEDDLFQADFPDSMDLKITNFCDLACPMCHENATTLGQHADLSADFLDKLHPGTELAIGGGNPLSHPELLPFLEKMKARGIICNLTVNEKHLKEYRAQIEALLQEKLIWGLGISLQEYCEATLEFAKRNPNTVLHLICGMIKKEELSSLFDKELKILLLGYKRFGRGVSYYSPKIGARICEMRHILPDILPRFAVVSFDNLAIEQLQLKKALTEDTFESMFMGEDGDATMYVDLVKREFALSSTAKERYPLLDTAEEMLFFLHHQKKK